MLIWIVWNRTVFDIETVYLYSTELFEIELLIYIRMDLALNDLECLMCIKTKRNETKLYSHINL